MRLEWNEQYRHQCEVRYCLSKGSAWFRVFIEGVAKKRGQPAADKLRADVRAQHAAGNTGKHGEWKCVEPPALTKPSPQ